MNNSRLLFALFIGTIFNIIFIAQPVQAAIFAVSNETELVNAINIANANGVNDTIILSSDIILTNSLPDISERLTIESQEGFDYTISRDISALDFSIFTVLPDVYFTIRFITLENGRNTNGGGINNTQGIVSIENSILSDNVAFFDGAGIYNNAGTLFITDSYISSNQVIDGNGAGIYNNGSLYIERSSISGNLNANDGGGIYNADLLLFNRVVISGNEAIQGAGIYHESMVTPRIFNTLISGNKADNGGGLFLDGSALITSNVTIASNLATRDGGGVYINSGSYEFSNSIIAGNSPAEPFIANGSLLMLNYSLTDSLGSASHSNSIINLDPLFTAPELATNAPTILGDYTLQATSLVIDAGSVLVALIMANHIDFSADLLGNNRFEQNVAVFDTGEGFPPLDMGAYEVQDDTCDLYEDFFSNAQVYDVGTINPDPAIDLRAAITCANNNNLSDTIALTSDVVLTDVDNFLSDPNGLPTILSDYGNSLTIEGNGFAITRQATAPNFRIMFVNGGADLTLRNITISGGDIPTGDGGGIAVASTASLHLLDSTISNNRADRGGGLRDYNTASMTIRNSVITGNIAISEGGGIYNGAAGNEIENTIISANTAERGGGIYIGLAPTIINTLISGNVANMRGGAIENQSIGTSIINSTITGNDAPLAGGIYDSGLNMVIVNSIHWGNLPITLVTDPSTTIDHSIVEGGFTGIENLDLDPRFTSAEPASNAPTSSGDYTLQENSPAIDSADKTRFLPFGTNITDDLAGNARFNDDGAILNIPSELDRGAYERQGNSCSGYETNYFALGIVYPIGTERADLASDLVFAMRCANSNTSDDTIVFTGDVILTDFEFSPRQVGLPHILRRSISGELTIDGNGFMLTRDVNAPDMMFFYIDYLGALTINNLMISNATGGAIRNEGLLIVNDSTFDSNTGYEGGAINNYSNVSEAYLTNVTMTNNVALLSGGAIYNAYFADLYITDSTLEYNRAELTGGAIRNVGNRSRVEIIRSSISYNTAFSYGGGIDGSSESMTIISSVFNGNVSQTQAGGAMRIGSEVLIENTIISGNSAFAGGAIVASGPSMKIINNSLITGNVATLRGGAIDNGSNLTITNTTIAGNYAPDGGAIFNYSNRPLNIINSILWGNSTNQIAYESVILTVSHSIVEGGQDGTNNLDADPLFVDFQIATLGNPTTAGDFSVQAGSPAIDSADDTVDIGLFDLAGNNRFVDDMGIANIPSILDRGAYEFQGTSNYTIAIIASDSEASENPIDNGQFIMSLSDVNRTGLPIHVTYSLAGSTASLEDFEFLRVGYEIPDGVQSILVDIVPINDALPEYVENVIMTLQYTDSNFVMIDPSAMSAQVNILDDDSTDVLGDCNADTTVDAGDLSALQLEIFDGDSASVLDDISSGFAGNPIGCDSNADNIIDAGDLSCTQRIIFDDQFVCGVDP